MPRIETRDISFESPDGWKDNTVYAFAGEPGPDGMAPPNVTIMKSPLPEGKDLAAFALQQVADLGGTLPKFELVHQRDTTASGLPASQILFHWVHPQGPLSQQVTMIAVQRVVWTVTGTARRGQLEAIHPQLERVLGSLRFPGAGAAPAPTSSRRF